MIKYFNKNWKLLVRSTVGILVVLSLCVIHTIFYQTLSPVLTLIIFFLIIAFSLFLGMLFSISRINIMENMDLKSVLKKDKSFPPEVFFIPDRFDSKEHIRYRISQFINYVGIEFPLKDQLSCILSYIQEIFPNLQFFIFQKTDKGFLYMTGTRISKPGKVEIIHPGAPIVAEVKTQMESDINTEKLMRKGYYTGSLEENRIMKDLPRMQLPLDFFSKLEGIFSIIDTNGHPFKGSDESLFAWVSEVIAMRIESSGFYNKQDKKSEETILGQIGNDLRARLIPESPPIFPDWDIALDFSPSSAITGDYVDFFHRPDSSLIVVIATTSGEGLEAAFFLARLKSLILSKYEECSSPASLLNFLAGKLTRSDMGEQFVTMSILKIKPKSRSVDFASAGHTTPLINRIRNGFVEIPTFEPGIPLGLFSSEGEIYSPYTFDLLPGDGIFLYTDGALENCSSDDERLTPERIRLVIEKIPEQDAQMMLDNIMKELKHTTKQTNSLEDQTMIYIKTE